MILKNLANYIVWSDEKYRELIDSISEADFVIEVKNRSVQGITSHILAALLTCFHVIEDDKEKFWEWLDDASRDELLKRWAEADVRLLKLILALPKKQVEVSHVSDESFSMDSADFVLQYILHTVHHRGQLALILRDLGYDIPPIDYLHYFAEQ